MSVLNIFYEGLKGKVRIVRGEGVYVYDEFGRRYLDASGGSNASVPIGHQAQPVIEAMLEQARKITFVPMHLFSNEPAELLAQELLKVSPPGFGSVSFVNSGSEATEYAVKAARQFWMSKGRYSKFKVVTRWQSFFGNTFGALSFGGHTFRRSRYIPYLQDMPHIPPAYCYRCWFRKDYPDCDIDCALYLDRVVKQEGPENVAAFIAEPIVGATTGATVPPKEYYPMVREICDRHDLLFIADEVQTGVGRTGEWFCMEHWKVRPDIVTVAKGLSGGYTPLGAVILAEHIAEQFQREGLSIVGGHTFNANPLSCAVGLAVIRYIVENDLVSRCRDAGSHLASSLRKVQMGHSIIGDVRGLGLMVGLEFVRNRETKEPYPPRVGLCHEVAREALESGVVVYPGSGTADGVSGDHILLTPPYIITMEQIDELAKALDGAIGAVESKHPPST
ncbi:aminotransferase class III-fold pyridoxal phosphate-dependent enzyme [Candidatus Bathyarchaeota archaeon]|nr:aminotransferase class III-fold pyridoxal phosphate-dependent enzyme [Candidatus Bathyarchaeota archaeon]